LKQCWSLFWGFIVARFLSIYAGNFMYDEAVIGVYLYTPNNNPSMDSRVKPLPRDLYSSASVINLIYALSITSVILLSIKISVAEVLKALFSDEFATLGRL